MTDKEKIDELWMALNEVVEYVVELNGLETKGAIEDLVDIGFTREWLIAFGFETEEIDNTLKVIKEGL